MRSLVTRRCYAVLDALREEGAGEAARAVWEDAADAVGRTRPSAIDPEDACLYAFTGWSYHTAHGDHRAASDVLNRFFEHPAAAKMNAVTRRLQRCNLASSLLRAGDVEQACSMYAAVLGGNLRGEGRTALHRGRDQVIAALSEMPQSAAAPGCLRDLAITLTRRLGQRSGLAALSRRAACVGELADLLRRTYERPASVEEADG